MAEHTRELEAASYAGIYTDEMKKKKTVSFPKIKPNQDIDKIHETMTALLSLQVFDIEKIKETQFGFIK